MIHLKRKVIMNFTTMPTSKKRINVTLSDELDHFLGVLAKQDDVPKATKAVKLIEIALELEEDRVLSKIAEERDTKDAKYVSHEEAWL